MLTEALAGAMGGETHGQGTLPPDCLVLLQGLLRRVGWVAKGEQVWQLLGGGGEAGLVVGDAVGGLIRLQGQVSATASAAGQTSKAFLNE
jgi:hypothetical protein